jgi:hypothetical protein
MHSPVAVIIAAVFGAILGYLGFVWMADQGVYALALPGCLLGLGAGMAGNRSQSLANVCGLGALGLGLFAEWKRFPFAVDDSLSYFVLHVHHLQPWTMLMLGVGTILGFWIPYSRADEFDKRRPAE